jgi:hypothetical protein
LATARDEIRRLRRALTAGPQQELTGNLASIARHIAAATTASTDLRERQEQEPIQARPSGPEAEAAGTRALRDLTAATVLISALHRIVGSRAGRDWLRIAHVGWLPAERT